MRFSRWPEELLSTYDDLVAWGQHAGVLDVDQAAGLLGEAAARPGAAAAVYAWAISFRESLYQLFRDVLAGRPPTARDLDTLNVALVTAMTEARVLRTPGGFSWTWAERGLSLDRVLWPVARSAADLLTSPTLSRVGQCAGESGCGSLFLDTTKNRSRRWCAMRDCGNRAKARRSSERRRSREQS
ncbi:MAG: CGNR zinc finger domain-containing protein [Chloroflexi bacterium]|nr:CGNR zinc finger domain-containing protein [Chloroflexota bacterium]